MRNNTMEECVPIIWTHDGSFQADEIIAISILKTLYPDAVVVRSRKKVQGAAFSVDVGKVYDHYSGSYDHHQVEGVPGHPCGSPSSSAGLVWAHEGRAYIKRSASDIWPKIKKNRYVDLKYNSGRVRELLEDYDLLGVAWEMIRKSVILPVDRWDHGYFPAPGKNQGLHFSAMVTALSDSGADFSEVLEFAIKALSAYAESALVKAVRSRCAAVGSVVKHQYFVQCPVKPYSMSWVRKYVPNTEFCWLAYYVDCAGIIEWVSDELSTKDNRGRATAAEFKDRFYKDP